MRLYAVYALPLKGKSQKKDELRKQLHTLHTNMRKVYSALLFITFPTSGLNCIQTAYTAHTNCIQTTVCKENVNTSMVTTDATSKTTSPTKPVKHADKPPPKPSKPNQKTRRKHPHRRTIRWDGPTLTLLSPDPPHRPQQGRHSKPSPPDGMAAISHKPCLNSSITAPANPARPSNTITFLTSTVSGSNRR